MSRVLGRIRLSRLTEESTSEARQREAITGWAATHGHEIIGWAVDLDVSGAVSPFEAPQLGPWLTERLSEWDILAAYRLDRVARRVVPLNALFGLCQDQGKTLVSVSESIDLSTWVGRMVANVIAGVAEGELEAIHERTQGSQRKIRELGRWHGGAAPYGYVPVKRGNAWYLDVDPDAAEIVTEVFRRAAERESIRGIAGDLTARGIPAPRGGEWSSQTLTRMLRSRWVLGQSEHNGRVVTDAEGMPLQRAEPIIGYAEYKHVQSVLSDRSRPKQRRYEQGMLLNVAYCADCIRADRGVLPLYLTVLNKPQRGQEYRYWQCSGRIKYRNGCRQPSIRAETLEREVGELVCDEIGDVERTERIWVPGDDTQGELDQIESAIAVARSERDAGLYEGDDDSYLARVRALVQRRNALRDQPAQVAGYVTRGLGETFGEAWQRATPGQRRLILLDAGVQVVASEDPKVRVLRVPDDVRERIGR